MCFVPPTPPPIQLKSFFLPFPHPNRYKIWILDTAHKHKPYLCASNELKIHFNLNSKDFPENLKEKRRNKEESTSFVKRYRRLIHWNCSDHNRPEILLFRESHSLVNELACDTSSSVCFRNHNSLQISYFQSIIFLDVLSKMMLCLNWHGIC